MSCKEEQPRPDYNFEPFPIYEPGATTEVEVRDTDQLGQPVKAEFSLALVDESLFAIYPDTLTPIKRFFPTRHPTRVGDADRFKLYLPLRATDTTGDSRDLGGESATCSKSYGKSRRLRT